MTVVTKTRTTGEISEQEILLINFIIYMQKRGLAESTIERRHRHLQVLAKRGANLLDIESVKKKISEQDWVGKSKNRAVDTYTDFLKMLGKTWDKPRYKEVEKLPFIPTEKEINDLIAVSNHRLATFLTVLKTTGARAGEAHNLRYQDVDFERNTINIRPEKGSKPRIIKMQNKLANMLLEIKRKNQPDTSRFFPLKMKSLRKAYYNTRKKQAWKLKNSRLKKITFHTFRHWKATTLYHKTKDIVYVQQFLGHRSINNTLKYIQLSEALFKDSGEYTCKIAKNHEEAIKLIEVGYTKVDEFDGLHLYRKPKVMGAG